LVPRLFDAGHDVTVVSRRQRAPYRPHGAWTRITHVELDRAAEEAEGSDRDAAVTLDDIRRSPHCSIAKARTLLGYAPRYS
jgi:hypothetical protein